MYLPLGKKPSSIKIFFVIQPNFWAPKLEDCHTSEILTFFNMSTSQYISISGTGAANSFIGSVFPGYDITNGAGYPAGIG